MSCSKFPALVIATGLFCWTYAAFAEDGVARDGVVSRLAVKPKTLRNGKPEEVGISPERLGRVGKLLRREVGENSKVAPGAVLLVARKGIVVLHEPFGFHRLTPAKEPMDVNHVFGLASITKPVVTAISLMILLEEGYLRLDDKIAKFIPEFGCNGKEEITVRQVLTHCSGLDNHPVIYRRLPKRTGADRKSRLRAICESKPTHKPDTRFIYTCCGYTLLGAVVEKLSGMPLNRFAGERIFTPLGMKTAKTNRDGNSGMSCSARDLAVFAQTMLNGGVYGDARILGPSTVQAMISRQARVDGVDYGLGWYKISSTPNHRSQYGGDITGIDSFGHAGWSGVVLWVDPDLELVIVFLTNHGEHEDGAPQGVREIMPRICNVVVSSIVEE